MSWVGGCRRCRWPMMPSSCSPTGPAMLGPISPLATTTSQRSRRSAGRLDGVPLAIELAAARVRALSVGAILERLDDRFRLLTDGPRTVCPGSRRCGRESTGHSLLTEQNGCCFAGWRSFLGGFDLGAARAIAGGGDVERYQVLDQLTLLVDKSLVVADDSGGRTRYRLLETVRQYALEKLGESGEADAVRSRHRDHYTSLAAVLDAPADRDYEQRVDQAEIEIDNLRAAFGWSRENSGHRARANAGLVAAAAVDHARPPPGRAGLVRRRPGRSRERAAPRGGARGTCACARRRGRARHPEVGAADSLDQAQQALAIAREVDDPALLARALTACGSIAAFFTRFELARRVLRRGHRLGPCRG